MIFKNAKFVCYRNDKMCFDVIVVDGENEIPYTYLEGNNSPIDIAIKNAVESGELTIAKTLNLQTVGTVETVETVETLRMKRIFGV